MQVVPISVVVWATVLNLQRVQIGVAPNSIIVHLLVLLSVTSTEIMVSLTTALKLRDRSQTQLVHAQILFWKPTGNHAYEVKRHEGSGASGDINLGF